MTEKTVRRRTVTISVPVGRKKRAPTRRAKKNEEKALAELRKFSRVLEKRVKTIVQNARQALMEADVGYDPKTYTGYAPNFAKRNAIWQTAGWLSKTSGVSTTVIAKQLEHRIERQLEKGAGGFCQALEKARKAWEKLRK